VDPNKENGHVKGKKRIILFSVLGFFTAMGYLSGYNAVGTFALIIMLITALNHLFFFRLSQIFQTRFLNWLEDFYLRILTWALSGIKPRLILLFTFATMIGTVFFFVSSGSQVELFPDNEPSYINVIVEIPVGSDIKVTNQFMREIENEVQDELKSDSVIVESILTSVGKGVVAQNEQAFGNTPEKGMTTISFIDYEERPDENNTSEILKRLGDRLIGKYPGVKISIEKNQMGPPVGSAINLEIIGQDFDKLVSTTENVLEYIRQKNIPGIEGLDIDIDVAKPELLIQVDREKARRFGLSTAQVGSAIRTSLFGKDISDYKDGEDEFPIRLRYAEEYRNNMSDILNHKIIFRNAQGKMLHIPISSVADMKYSTTYGKVKRKDMDRVITISSNVLEGYNTNEINEQIKQFMTDYEMPDGYSYKFTGEQEEMMEATSFLLKAMLIGLGLIIIILVTQFNSVAKPLIIMASVLFSTIGVFGGLATFGMNFIIIMTGVGIISLAGIVVNNAIVLIDYIDLLKNNERDKLGFERDENLPLEVSRDCVIRAGKTRLRPVLLTAITTILGLLPMALGMNIDFAGLLNSFQPNIYFGGENADFWGPMAWTVIFGLSFATFLTLIVVPAMYLMGNKIKLYFVKATK
jgi:multidrug efflux pump subunit AcrB